MEVAAAAGAVELLRWLKLGQRGAELAYSVGEQLQLPAVALAGVVAHGVGACLDPSHDGDEDAGTWR